MENSKPHRVWTVAQAKARLSEILRLAEEEGPQHIGMRKPFVVVPGHVWTAKDSPRKPLGQWLVENMPRGVDIEIPGNRESRREIPFFDSEIGRRRTYSTPTSYLSRPRRACRTL